MTNAEKYLKDGADIEELAENLGKFIFMGNRGIKSEIKDFFSLKDKDKNKPTLTEDERVILRNIDKMYSIISRTRNNHSLYVATPNIHEIGGQYAETRVMPFDHLFQFIKGRRRILY